MARNESRCRELDRGSRLAAISDMRSILFRKTSSRKRFSPRGHLALAIDPYGRIALMKKQGFWLTILRIGMWVGLANGVIFSLVAVGSAAHTVFFLAGSIRAQGTVT